MESPVAEKSSKAKTIFDAIGEGDLVEFKNLLSQHKGNIDFHDENGLTVLQLAAYKGNKDMVQLLLDRGADVNSSNHQYNYTALHFAALSGNAEVCKLLLDAGAKPSATNSVNRTAAQMAAFVGNHNVVATINNYVPVSDIVYYTKIQGLQTEPYLPAFLVEPLHKLILGVNLHPVRIGLNLKSLPGLLENADKVSKVLEMMSKKEMTKGHDTNEVMAFKYYYFSYIVQEIHNIQDKQRTDNDKEEKKDVVEIFVKKLLKPGKDMVTLNVMDAFLKRCVSTFPYRECTLFQQMVMALTGDNPQQPLYVITCTINGQRGFVDAIPYCSTCGEENPAKKCSKCKSVNYCDRECQRLHWFVHKKTCNPEAPPPVTPSKEKVNVDANELSSELKNLITG